MFSFAMPENSAPPQPPQPSITGTVPQTLTTTTAAMTPAASGNDIQTHKQAGIHQVTHAAQCFMYKVRQANMLKTNGIKQHVHNHLHSTMPSRRCRCSAEFASLQTKWGVVPVCPKLGPPGRPRQLTRVSHEQLPASQTFTHRAPVQTFVCW